MLDHGSDLIGIGQRLAVVVLTDNFDSESEFAAHSLGDEFPSQSPE
jgi:hypothetical protein